MHLTLNAEHDRYRWGPITHAPSLLDGDGGFPRTVTDVWDHADLDEVRRELRAQVERAILWGFDVSHLDSHMGTLQLRPEFFDVYLDLAVEFGLPLRLSGASSERSDRVPVPAARRRGGRGVPRPLRAWCAGRGLPAHDRAGGRRTSAPASPRSTSTPPSTPPSCGPGRRLGRTGSTTTSSSPATGASASSSIGPACTGSGSGRSATCSVPPDATGARVARRRRCRPPRRSAGCGERRARALPPRPTCEEIDLSVDHTIVVDDDGFDPATLEIDRRRGHPPRERGRRPSTRFTADDRRFDTGRMQPGDDTTLVLTEPGEVTVLRRRRPRPRGHAHGACRSGLTSAQNVGLAGQLGEGGAVLVAVGERA